MAEDDRLLHSLPEISYNNARSKYFIIFSMYRCQVKVYYYYYYYYCMTTNGDYRCSVKEITDRALVTCHQVSSWSLDQQNIRVHVEIFTLCFDMSICTWMDGAQAILKPAYNMRKRFQAFSIPLQLMLM